MKGYQHLFTLALAAENIARQAYQADAYFGANHPFAVMAMERALAAADQVTAIASEIRMAQGQSDAA